MFPICETCLIVKISGFAANRDVLIRTSERVCIAEYQIDAIDENGSANKKQLPAYLLKTTGNLGIGNL
jgi:hypothetical protein